MKFVKLILMKIKLKSMNYNADQNQQLKCTVSIVAACINSKRCICSLPLPNGKILFEIHKLHDKFRLFIIVIIILKASPSTRRIILIRQFVCYWLMLTEANQNNEQETSSVRPRIAFYCIRLGTRGAISDCLNSSRSSGYRANIWKTKKMNKFVLRWTRMIRKRIYWINGCHLHTTSSVCHL